MAVYTKRVQTVLTDAQYEMMMELAQEFDKPLSGLIREAIELTYFVDHQRKKQQHAVEQILALRAPVSDWEQMEDEIINGVLE